MSEIEETVARPTDPVGRVLYWLARGLSLLGGIVVFAMAVTTTVSITGRAVINKPVYGDFEIITISTGVAVFLFLPLCQLMRENVIVDFFMVKAPERLKGVCDAGGSLIYGVIVAVMCWRTTVGGIGVYNNNEETVLLSWPLWWTFPLAVFCLFVLLCVCVYTLAGDLTRARRGTGF